MTPEAMASLHRRASAGTRPWSAAEYAQLTTAKNRLLITAEHGFVLGQLSAADAEIFMIIVEPDHQRKGLGLNYLTRFEIKAYSAGGSRCLLEVAASNHAAQALYTRASYTQVGTRKGYYKLPNGQPDDAWVMQKQLNTLKQPHGI